MIKDDDELDIDAEEEHAQKRTARKDDQEGWDLDFLPEGVREYAEQARDYALKHIEDNPGRALAIAFGAGALTAAFFGGSKSGRKTVRKMVKSLPKSVRKPLRKVMP